MSLNPGQTLGEILPLSLQTAALLFHCLALGMLFTWNNEQAGCAKITWLTNETLHTQRQLCFSCSRIAQRIMLELLVSPLQLLRLNRDPETPKGFSQILPTRIWKPQKSLSHLEVTLGKEMPPLFNLRFSECKANLKEHPNVKWPMPRWAIHDVWTNWQNIGNCFSLQYDLWLLVM